MKKIYTTPKLVVSGALIASTQSPASSDTNEDGTPFQKNPSFGAVGFGL